MPAIPALIAVGGTIAAAEIQRRRDKKNAEAQLQANREALAATGTSEDKAIGAEREQMDYERWLQSATGTLRKPFLDEAASLAGQDGSNYAPAPYAPAGNFVPPTEAEATNDPGFQMAVAQGQRGIEHSAAARGTILTGGTGKAIADYNRNAAADKYAEVYGRAQSLFALNEGLRKQAYDTNNQNDFNAASLKESGRRARIAELLQIAGLQTPGPYPGRDTTPRNPGGWVPGMQTMGSGGDGETPRTYRNGIELQFDVNSDPWSWYGGRSEGVGQFGQPMSPSRPPIEPTNPFQPRSGYA